MIKSLCTRSALFALAALSLFSHGALAVDVEPATVDLSKAISGKYILDPSHTSITFKLTHMGISNYTGRFNKISGDLQFDAKNPSKSVLNVAIDPTSVDVNHPKLNAEISTLPDALNSAEFPVITFTSKTISQKSDTTGVITGDLTLLGVSKPVTLDVVFNGRTTNPFSKKPMLGFSATGSLSRAEFGAKVWEPMIGDEVKFSIETEFSGE